MHVIIGGQDYTREELFGWHPVHLVGLILKYQETRTWWHRADATCASTIAALGARLKAAEKELAGARAELAHRKLRRAA